jgi:hypothetical protein
LAQWRRNSSQRCCFWMYASLSCMLRLDILLALGPCAALPPPAAVGTAGPTGRVCMKGIVVVPKPTPAELLCTAGANTGMKAASSTRVHVSQHKLRPRLPAVALHAIHAGCCCQAAKSLCTVQTRNKRQSHASDVHLPLLLRSAVACGCCCCSPAWPLLLPPPPAVCMQNT